EEAASFVARGLIAPGLALLFMASVAILVSIFAFDEPRVVFIVIAAAIGAYMALNIGANDVANNVGPGVGARALTMGGALVIAAAIGAYMALNIGANDVANNVGPAVGARALTMGGALVIAAVFETAGALIAGGDVVETISKGIIDPAAVADSAAFMHLMLAAL